MREGGRDLKYHIVFLSIRKTSDGVGLIILLPVKLKLLTHILSLSLHIDRIVVMDKTLAYNCNECHSLFPVPGSGKAYLRVAMEYNAALKFYTHAIP